MARYILMTPEEETKRTEDIEEIISILESKKGQAKKLSELTGRSVVYILKLKNRRGVNPSLSWVSDVLAGCKQL